MTRETHAALRKCGLMNDQAEVLMLRLGQVAAIYGRTRPFDRREGIDPERAAAKRARQAERRERYLREARELCSGREAQAASGKDA